MKSAHPTIICELPQYITRCHEPHLGVGVLVPYAISHAQAHEISTLGRQLAAHAIAQGLRGDAPRLAHHHLAWSVV